MSSGEELMEAGAFEDTSVCSPVIVSADSTAGHEVGCVTIISEDTTMLSYTTKRGVTGLFSINTDGTP